MSDDPNNLVLNLLRAIRGDIGDIKADMIEVKQRLTTVEIQVSNLAATEASHYGQTMQRLDRIGGDMDRIKRRLDLVDAS